MKRGILLLFFSFFLIKISASSYPDKISNEALISIVNVDYKKEKSSFSKSALRIYDKSTGFDEVVDFSYFENFDDPLFSLKFYFLGGKAKIISVPFLDFSEKESDVNNAEISEIILDLTYPELSYIFDFLKNMNESLPLYQYDFDLEKNNSFTHISAILNDASSYFPQANSSRPFFSYSRNLTKKLEGRQKEAPIKIFSSKQDFYDTELKKSFKELTTVSFSIILALILIASLVFLYTIYQTLVFIKKRFFIDSLFKAVQTLDFLLLFFSGALGTLVLLQDFFSGQSVFRNNFQFLYLFPLNLVMAFDLYFSFLTGKFKKLYWIAVSVLAVLYIVFAWIFSREFPLLDLLVSLPLFIRAVYFAFFTNENQA